MKNKTRSLAKHYAPGAVAEIDSRPQEEQERIRKWSRTKGEQKKNIPTFVVTEIQGTRTLIPRDGTKDMLAYAQVAELLQTANNDRTTHLIDQITGIFYDMPPDKALNTALATLHDLAPQDSLEVLLSVQMLATHNVAVEMLRRSLISEQTMPCVESCINRATKLLRTFTAQLEALNRHRGKGGEQRVVVQHVNVTEGGQAIVGNITKGAGGTGE